MNRTTVDVEFLDVGDGFKDSLLPVEGSGFRENCGSSWEQVLVDVSSYVALCSFSSTL